MTRRSGVAGRAQRRGRGPGDAAWDQARQAWNLAADQRPAAVAFARSDDVRAAVAIAASEGLKVAAQATGHGASSLGLLNDAVLLKTARMASVEVDAERSLARLEAGALAGDVVAPAPSTASRRWSAPRWTSESSASPSGAASAGSAASTAWPATASAPPRS